MVKSSCNEFFMWLTCLYMEVVFRVLFVSGISVACSEFSLENKVFCHFFMQEK